MPTATDIGVCERQARNAYMQLEEVGAVREVFFGTGNNAVASALSAELRDDRVGREGSKWAPADVCPADDRKIIRDSAMRRLSRSYFFHTCRAPGTAALAHQIQAARRASAAELE